MARKKVSARTAQFTTSSRGATRNTSEEVAGCADVASAALVNDGSLLVVVVVNVVIVAALLCQKRQTVKFLCPGCGLCHFPNLTILRTSCLLFPAHQIPVPQF